MQLDIELKKNDLKIIKRIKQNLLNKYNPKRESDIEKIIELANYLVSLNEIKESESLLNSSIYLNPADNEEHLWVTNVQGVVLLAYIARLNKNSDLYKKYILILEKYDIWPIDIGKINWVKMHIEDHKKKVDYALTEGHKYKCSVIGQEVLSFLYFYEMLFINEKLNFFSKIKVAKVKDILFESQRLLNSLLNENK